MKWSEVARSCPTLCDPIDCSLPGSSVHGILQARILKWVVMPSSRGSSRPRGWIQVSCITGRFFTFWATREALTLGMACHFSKMGYMWFLPPNHFCLTLWTLEISRRMLEKGRDELQDPWQATWKTGGIFLGGCSDKSSQPPTSRLLATTRLAADWCILNWKAGFRDQLRCGRHTGTERKAEKREKREMNYKPKLC